MLEIHHSGREPSIYNLCVKKKKIKKSLAKQEDNYNLLISCTYSVFDWLGRVEVLLCLRYFLSRDRPESHH